MNCQDDKMRARIGHAILLVTGIAAVGVGAWVGGGIRYSVQVDLLRELREVSTIIFGIVGAWAAIVYPGELMRKLRATDVSTVEPSQLANFRALMRCLLLSAMIVVSILVIQFAAPVIASLDWSANCIVLLRRISFAIACLLGVVQIWVVLLMLIPINAADADVRHTQELQEHVESGPQGTRGTRKKRKKGKKS